MEIKPGTYRGKIEDYGINETQKGNPQVFIRFHIPEIQKSLTWFGSLVNDKAVEITCKALINCGFAKTDLALLTKGKDSGELDMNKELSLELQEDVYEGKKRIRIQWVNLPYSGVQNKLDQAGAVQKLSGLNVAGKMMQLQQEMGIQQHVTSQSNQQSATQQTGYASDKAPF